VSLEAVTDPVRVIRYGILKPRVPGTAGVVPYIEVKDLQGNTLAGKTLNRTTPDLDTQFAGARVLPNDLVMAVRGSYERCAVVPAGFEGTNLSRDVARIAPLPCLRSDYLHAWLRSSFSRRYFARHARGVAVKGINIATLRALPIVVPDLEVQQEAMTRLSLHVESLGRLRIALEDARRRVSILRRSLLAAAFTGQF
jgi:type I restriction enzyme S subunit